MRKARQSCSTLAMQLVLGLAVQEGREAFHGQFMCPPPAARPTGWYCRQPWLLCRQLMQAVLPGTSKVMQMQAMQTQAPSCRRAAASPWLYELCCCLP